MSRSLIRLTSRINIDVTVIIEHTPMEEVQHSKVETSNGYQLSAQIYRPDGNAKAAVLIVPAMGVSQSYYSSFASWLSSHGYVVATFDYSDIGLSLTGELRDSTVTISDWAKYDCTAMIEATSVLANGKPLYWIGHSLGGQIYGMVPDVSRITKVINIAGGSGYWLENVASLKWRVWWLWFFVLPLALKITGYFPGKRLRKVGDLPGGVMRQWRKWCLNPEYMVGSEGEEAREMYRAVVIPISSYSFTDDELMSKNNIDSLNSFYASAKIKLNRISPDAIGTNRNGHFGFFKDKFKESLWNRYLLQELH